MVMPSLPLASTRDRASTGQLLSPRSLSCSEAHARPPSILVDELDTCGLECRADFRACLIASAKRPVLRFQALYGGDRDIRRRCKPLLGPCQQSTGRLDLAY